MTAEMFTRGWVRTYTRGLPDDVRAARRDEIDSDLHEHRSTGAPGAAIVGRTLRGVPADVMWRREERRAMETASGGLSGVRALWATATQVWFAPIAVLVGLFNVLMAVAVLVNLDGDSKGPGRVIGPAILLALATALFAGLRLRWRSGRGAPAPATATAVGDPPAASRSTLGLRVGLGAVALLAVVAVVVGAMGSLLLLGIGVLALGGAAAVAARRRSGSARIERPAAGPRATGAQGVMLADVLIIIGTLPALGLWWMVIPPILALVVIAGVIGTGPGARRRAAV